MNDYDVLTIKQTALNMLSASRSTTRVEERKMTQYNWSDAMDGLLLSDGLFHPFRVEKYDSGVVMAIVEKIDGDHTAHIALVPEVY